MTSSLFKMIRLKEKKRTLLSWFIGDTLVTCVFFLFEFIDNKKPSLIISVVSNLNQKCVSIYLARNLCCRTSLFEFTNKISSTFRVTLFV